MSDFLGRYDLLIAFGLIGITVALFLIYRMRILPKKSLPYLAVALTGVLGLALFKKWRSDKLNDDLEKLEKELKKREEKLKDLKKTYKASDRKLQEIEAELDRHRAAYEKEILLIKAENKEAKKEIDALSGEELHDTFRKAFGHH
jgi:DNA anti-recombination protein RmuC